MKLKLVFTLAGLTLLVSLTGLLLAQSSSPPSGDLTLRWEYPTNELSPDLFFQVYHSDNITTPLRDWSVVTNMNWTNVSFVVSNETLTLRYNLTVVPGKHFFVMTASNFWGTSDFSEVVSTPALPRSDANLKVFRATQ